MEVVVHECCPLCSSRHIKLERIVKDHSISQEEFELYRCSDCSFLFTQGAPASAAIGKYYASEDYISHSDTREGLINKLYHQARQYMLSRKYNLVRRLTAGKKLLDVGCGTGYFPDFMSNKGYEVLGVEVDEEARSFGRKHFGLTILPPEDLQNGKIKSTFDVISLWHVLEHLHDLHHFMDVFRDLLEDDGYLLIAVPNHRCFDSQKYQSYWAGYDVPRHLWHFSPETLGILANQHQFEVVDKQLMPLDPFYNSMLSEKYKGHGMGLITGGFTGLTALIKGQSNTDLASSIIYILQKDKSKTIQ